jgi:serine phosphatase RsbU (regulator of sigma subunit)
MRTFSLPNTHWHPELDYYAFCQCAYEHSGNFYDFIPQDGSRLAVSIGDLPSTGVHSINGSSNGSINGQSINVPCLQALVRGLTAGSRDDLTGLARELNGTLYLLGPQDLCVPWFYARIDPVRRQVQYVNAGHEPPLLIRQNSAIHRLERTGAALGLSARGLHRQETAAIEAGDVLAIFSEAVCEETVLDVVLENPHAGSAELTQRVLEGARKSTTRPWMGEDRTFAAVRVLGACRHPLSEAHAEEGMVLCAA